jgi:hypothetical protein
MSLEDDQEGVMIWLAVHAWFEGALAERAMIVGDLGK